MPIYYSTRPCFSIQTWIFVIVTISGVIFDSGLLIKMVLADYCKLRIVQLYYQKKKSYGKIA